MIRAFEESNAETMNAGGLKSKMLTLDAAFDEHNYGARSFRVPAMLPERVERRAGGRPDLAVQLIEEPRKSPNRRRPSGRGAVSPDVAASRKMFLAVRSALHRL